MIGVCARQMPEQNDGNPYGFQPVEKGNPRRRRVHIDRVGADCSGAASGTSLRTNLAGFPATTTAGGTGALTTAPAETTAAAPMSATMTAPSPIQAFAPIC